MAVVTFSYRHLAILGIAATVACGGGRSAGVSPARSPATPEAALEQFLTAVNAADLDQMAMLWGDQRGPEGLTHTMTNETRMQRLTIMQRVLLTDSHQFTATDASDPGKRVITVAMTQGTRHFDVPFTLVPMRAGGWIVNDIKLDAAMPQRSDVQRN
jgi:hypothetical protein